MSWNVSKEQFAQLVERALAELPTGISEVLNEVAVEILQRPTVRMMENVGLNRNELLLGLYRGRPVTRRSVEESGQLPDIVYIFQESIEQVSQSEDELVDNVRTTVLHEIGHHFGLDEEELRKLGYH